MWPNGCLSLNDYTLDGVKVGYLMLNVEVIPEDI